MLHCNYLFENASVCLVMWVLWEDVGLVGRKESNEAKILAMRETGFLKIVYRPASNGWWFWEGNSFVKESGRPWALAFITRRIWMCISI